MAQDADEVRQAIVQDRAELADTVHALASKADVKSRLRDKTSQNIEELQRRAAEAGGRLRDMAPDEAQDAASSLADTIRSRPVPFAVLAGFASGFLLGRMVRSRD